MAVNRDDLKSSLKNFDKINFDSIPNQFIDEDCKINERWFIWLNRIKDGERAEVDLISKFGETFPEDQSCCNDGNEELMNSLYISRLMYAALIVAMWSEIERFLKNICWEVQSIKQNKTTSIGGIKKIKEILEEAGIDLAKVNYYEYADTVRILNNIFKHQSGICSSRDISEINDKKTLPTIKDNIEGRQVCCSYLEYEKIPFDVVLVNCGHFCSHIIQVVKGKL